MILGVGASKPTRLVVALAKINNRIPLRYVYCSMRGCLPRGYTVKVGMHSLVQRRQQWIYLLPCAITQPVRCALFGRGIQLQRIGAIPILLTSVIQKRKN